MTQTTFSRDFDELEVGDGHVSSGRTITEADVVNFACLTGDHHPQHVDSTWAAAGLFGERIAHGALLLSYALGMMPLDPARVVALRRVTDAVFKRPVRFGDTVHVQAHVEHLAALDEQLGLVRCQLRMVNQDHATVARIALEVLWRRGEAAGATDVEDRAARGRVREAVATP